MLRVHLLPRAVVGPVLGLALCAVALSGCGGTDDTAPAPTSGAPSSSPSSSSGAAESDSAPAPGSPSTSASDSSSPTADPSDDTTAAAQPGAPRCASLWTAGGRIPRVYSGCNDGDTFVARDTLACSSGQRLARFGDRFYGVLGGTVTKSRSSLDADKGYRDAVASCRA